MHRGYRNDNPALIHDKEDDLIALLTEVNKVETVDPSSLRPHPYNEQIYGQESVDDLKEKIRETNRIETTLVITQNNVIISGHRRWRAALELELTSVPVERRHYANEIDELEALLLANLFRAKTVEQKVKEAEYWNKIYTAKGEQEQKAQGEIGKAHGYEGGRPLQPPDTVSTNSEKPLGDTCRQGVSEDATPQQPQKPKQQRKRRAPRTSDKAAAQTGLGSGKTLERAQKAVDVIKRLELLGKTDEANTLRHILNAPKGVAPANQVAEMPLEKQLIVLGMIRSGKVKTVKAAELAIAKAQRDAQAQAAPSKPKVTLASWEKWLPEQPECDLLITDPPYSTDIEDIETFANAWLPVALSKVKTTGRAYVCIGAYPQELKAYLSVHASMEVRQVLVWSYKNTMGPKPTHDYKQNWQAILYFVGKDAPPLDCPELKELFSANEINAPDGRLGNQYHGWQKPDELADMLIRQSTKQGDLVLDCFSGTGTFLLAAHRWGRVAFGCDCSEEMLKIAEQRGCEVLR